MKTILSMPNEQAQKELRKFALLGLPLSLLGTLSIGWIGAGGLAFGGRALVLAFHKGNRKQSSTLGYRLLAGFVFLLGLVDLIWFYNHLGK